ncbi:tripartite tricarboxylate transporter substrate-binding protein, partial [Acinetobacter baumannii]
RLARTVRALAAFCALLLSSLALGQTYPAHALRMVIPFPPAGPADIVGRLVAAKLSTALGQQVVVDNTGGGNGNSGADIVAHAPPDGYTLM